MTSVSLVRPEDIPEIEPLCHRAFDQMGYTISRGYTYSSQHITDTIQRGITSTDHICTKYVENGMILGFMAVGLTDFSFYSVDQRQAFEIVWHGDPLLSPGKQLRVMAGLLKDMLKRVNVDIFSLTLDEKHLELLPFLKRYGFVGSTRTVIRRW